MKKLITVIAVFALLLTMFACTGDGNKEEKTYKIGICNYVDDASLNQIYDNIKAKLEATGKEKGVKFEIKYENCNADPNLLTQIVSNFITDKVDMMIGIATPVAMTMQAMTEDNKIPVVFAAVSDPVGAKIVDTLAAPGANITGTSDYLDTNAVMNLIFAADPNASKIGLLYDAGQDASTTAIAEAKAYLEKKGIQYVEKTGTNVDEIALAAQALVAEGVNAVFTPSDNTVMTAELTIYDTFAKAKIPHYAGADSFALNGAFVGYGVDYANLGAETGAMAADILLGGKDPGKVAVKTFDNGTATVNTEICEQLGLDFETIKTAFTPFCTSVKTITTAEDFN